MSQSVVQSPWQTYLASASRSRPGYWGDYFRGFSITAWLFLLIVSFWWLREWRDIFEVRESGVDKYMQYAAFGVALVAHLTLGIGVLTTQSFRFLATTKGRIMTIFCLIMIATSPLSLVPSRSAFYAFATLGVAIVCYWAWQTDYDRFRNVMLFTGALMFVFLILLIFQHGLSRTSVGGIQRNKYGQAALTAMVCVFFARGKLRWVGVPVCAALLLTVSSRGSMLAMGMFILTYLFLKKGAGWAVSAGFVGLVLGIAVLAVPKIGKQASSTVVDDVMKLNDAGRGLGSGFTGRLDRWKDGMSLFMKKPAVGWGFRSRTNDPGFPQTRSAHSGYINLLIDTGIIGFGLIVSLFGLDFFKRLGMIRALKSGQDKFIAYDDVEASFDLNCIVCGLLVAEGMLWLFEPLYLNLGAPLLVMLYLLLMSPMRIPIAPMTRSNKCRDLDDAALAGA